MSVHFRVQGLISAICLLAAVCMPAFADTTDLVRKAMKAAYIKESATEPCTAASGETFGWPKDFLIECTYAQADRIDGKTRERKAIALILMPDAAVVARWIDNACAKVEAAHAACVSFVVAAGKSNSGFQFVVSGNVLEDIDPENGIHENYSFRDGMTVRITPGFNGSETDFTISDQTQIMNAANDRIIAIKSGKTRYWGTTPRQFGARFPDAGAPADLSSQQARTAWLSLAQSEFAAALNSPENRLLEAWLCANAKTKFGTDCKS